MYITEETKEKVWEKGTVIKGFDPYIWRQDFAGAWIRRDLYGTIDDYGWDVGHLKPYRVGGSDNLDNLMPIQWRNNAHKGNHYPIFRSIMSNNGKAINGEVEVCCNTEYEQKWEGEKVTPKNYSIFDKIKKFFKSWKEKKSKI
jgi:hypothetical protein